MQSKLVVRRVSAPLALVTLASALRARFSPTYSAEFLGTATATAGLDDSCWVSAVSAAPRAAQLVTQ